jgi:hypothetical protein
MRLCHQFELFKRRHRDRRAEAAHLQQQVHRFGKHDFGYDCEEGEYRCPAGGRANMAPPYGRGRHDAARVLIVGLPVDCVEQMPEAGRIRL